MCDSVGPSSFQSHLNCMPAARVLPALRLYASYTAPPVQMGLGSGPFCNSCNVGNGPAALSPAVVKRSELDGGLRPTVGGLRLNDSSHKEVIGAVAGGSPAVGGQGRGRRRLGNERLERLRGMDRARRSHASASSLHAGRLSVRTRTMQPSPAASSTAACHLKRTPEFFPGPQREDCKGQGATASAICGGGGGLRPRQ